MANEVMDLTAVKINYTPAELAIMNYESLSAMVEEYADRYNNLVISEDDRAGLTQARSDLLGLHKALDEQRKEVKRAYNKPLDAFEGKIKYLTELIDAPLATVRQGIQDLDEAERQAREDALTDYLTKQVNRVNGLGEVTIAIEDIDAESKWLNKGNWTDKLQPRQSLKDEVLSVIEQVADAKKQYMMDVEVVKNFCTAMDVEPDGWIAQLSDRRPTEIIKDITELVASRAQMAQDKADAVDDMAMDTPADTPADDFVEEPEAQPLPGEVKFNDTLITNIIEVTGTIAQLQGLNNFLKTSGIKVRRVG